MEEHARDSARDVDALLVALCRVVAALDRPLVRGHGVLVRLDASARPEMRALLAERRVRLLVHCARDGFVPAERQVRRRDDLDEVHEVVLGVLGALLGPVERVRVVVVCPLPAAGDLVFELRSEAELVDHMLHRVRDGGLVVLGQIVHVGVAVCEAAAWRDVEVPNDLVHSEDALDAAAF